MNTAYALQKFGEAGEKAIPDLIKLLEDPNSNVRKNAAVALGNIGKFREKITSQLTILLKDPSDSTRIGANFALSNMGEFAKEAIPDLIKSSQDPDEEVRKSAVDALIEISDKLRATKENLSLSELNQVISDLDQSSETLGGEENQLEKITKNLSSLKNERTNRLLNLIIEFIKKYPFSLLIPLCIFGYYFTLWRFPRFLLLIPSELTMPKPCNVKVPLGIVRSLKYNSRTLDAWIAHHLTTARKTFSEFETVKQRSSHVDLRDKAYLEKIRIFFSKKEFRLLIYGDGGIGKTNLACQIAQWVMTEEVDKRPCKHIMLPVLLEQDFDSEVDKNEQLLNAIKGRLKRLVKTTDNISDELLEQLLRHSRLLVIVDHFSELNKDTQKSIKFGSPDFPVKALIVTSRIREELDLTPKDELSIPRIGFSAGEVVTFLEDYLKIKQKPELFSSPAEQREFLDYSNCLITMAGSKGITALLAKGHLELKIFFNF